MTTKTLYLVSTSTFEDPIEPHIPISKQAFLQTSLLKTFLLILFIDKSAWMPLVRLGSWLLKDLEEFSGRKLKKEAAKRQLLGNEMGDGHNSNEIPRNWIVGI